MKNFLIVLLAVALFLSCNNGNKEDQNNNTDSNSIASINAVKDYVPEIEKTTFTKNGNFFYIISVAGTADIKEAVEKVKELKSQGHPAGYLWIPEFESLSKKEMYSVFIGTFSGRDTTIKYLEKYKKTDANAYAVLVSKEAKRETIFGKFDIRINDVRHFLILTYAKPDEVEEYFNNGGEDWGWFVGDVGDFFRKHYPDKVLMESVYNGWLLPKDIKALEKELGLEQFGYVFINGKNKSFTPHDTPDGVIRNACEFFGLKYIESTGDD